MRCRQRIVAAVVRPHLRRHMQMEDRLVRFVQVLFVGRFVRSDFIIIPVGRPVVRIVRRVFERPRRFFRQVLALVRRRVRHTCRTKQRSRHSLPCFRGTVDFEQRPAGSFIRRARSVVGCAAGFFVGFRRSARFVRTAARRRFPVRRRLGARNRNMRRRQRDRWGRMFPLVRRDGHFFPSMWRRFA